MNATRAAVEECLARAIDPAGEGRFVFTALDPERIRRSAEAADTLPASGPAPWPIAGLPISLKDLIDVEGEVTTAGAGQFRHRAPATADATVVTRLKQAGAVLFGRTNLTEFAFTGVGLNPHFGTPANPFDRKRRLIP